MLTKIFVKQLCNSQHLNKKQVEQNNKKILESVRNKGTWSIKGRKLIEGMPPPKIPIANA